MKARLLTKLLNDTKYTVNNNRDYIAVGSPMCHDLISVDKKTLKIRYGLDTFLEGRKSLEGKTNAELASIWDKLHELIENGQIKDIIDGVDEIENPLPVFTIEDGKLVETCTDKYGYPNTTISGEIMYENTHFKTREEAIKHGIEEYEAGVRIMSRRLKELEEDVSKVKNEIIKEQGFVDYLRGLKK